MDPDIVDRTKDELAVRRTNPELRAGDSATRLPDRESGGGQLSTQHPFLGPESGGENRLTGGCTGSRAQLNLSESRLPELDQFGVARRTLAVVDLRMRTDA